MQFNIFKLIIFIIIIYMYIHGIITILIFSFIIYFITKNLITFERSLELKNRDLINTRDRSIFTRFVIKNTIIAGSLAFVIGLKTRDLIQSLLDSIINPFFKDKKRITEVTKLFGFSIFGMKFCFSDFILDLIKYIIFMLISYLIVILVYVKTDFIVLQYNNNRNNKKDKEKKENKKLKLF